MQDRPRLRPSSHPPSDWPRFLNGPLHRRRTVISRPGRRGRLDGARPAGAGRQEGRGALLDKNLPGEDGLSLLRHLRQLQPQCQAMVLTAYGNLHEVEDLARPAYLFLALDSTC